MFLPVYNLTICFNHVNVFLEKYFDYLSSRIYIVDAAFNKILEILD